MKIAGTEYNLERKTFEIYFSGCNKPHCDGCHNPELWDHNIGNDWTLFVKKFEKKIKSNMIEHIWLLGGDPLDQNQKELIDFLFFLKPFDIPIWIWTKAELEEIPIKIRDFCSYIKTGPYKKELPEYIDNETNIKLASNNQKILKIKKF